LGLLRIGKELRSIYIDQNKLSTNSTVLIQDQEALHHLLNVIRIRKNEKVLLFDGLGACVESEVVEIQKKAIELKLGIVNHSEQTCLLDLGVAATKKNQITDIVSNAQQIGFNKLRFFESEYSQKINTLNVDRMNKVAISSLEQSNNPFLLKIELCVLKNILDEYEQIIVFDLIDKEESGTKNEFHHQKSLILLGPEGGFSSNERKLFKTYTELGKLKLVKLPTYILRTHTALSFAAGYLSAATPLRFNLES
jgi:16S rRNA (uracil1498-N3)-methyltransferase